MFQEKILSFDIGIKNMAFCLFSLNSYDSEYNQHPFEINEWVVLNLMDEPLEIKETCTQQIINNSSKKSPKKQKKIITIENLLVLDNNQNHVLDNQERMNKEKINLCGKTAKYKKSGENSETVFFCVFELFTKTTGPQFAF
jgi:hypothetical protein